MRLFKQQPLEANNLTILSSRTHYTHDTTRRTTCTHDSVRTFVVCKTESFRVKYKKNKRSYRTKLLSKNVKRN